jgi:hypothetical protein
MRDMVANVPNPLPGLDEALIAIPAPLRGPLIDCFTQALADYRAADWERVGIQAARMCDIAYCICAGHILGRYPREPYSPSNLPQACRLLEHHEAEGGRGIAVQIPRVVAAMHELRAGRSDGVTPDRVDADLLLRGMQWVMAEFVRRLSRLSEADARALAEAISSRTDPAVWSSGSARRVLEASRTAAQKALILLYAEGRPVPVSALRSWIEYRNPTEFRRKVLAPLHERALVHVDDHSSTVEILPPGQTLVEQTGLLVA